MPSVADPRRFQCSLCHIHIPNCKEDWLRHLIEKPHRRKAMKEFIDWSDQERRNSLLIFSNFPLMECTSLRGRNEEKVSAGAVTFLQKFIFRAGVVTRFLCWADKPNVAVVKFEEYWTMRNKLCEVMVETRWPENNKTVKISLDNQDQYFVQTGFMSMYSKLEVLAILPSEAYKPPPANDVIQLPVECFSKKPTDPLIDDSLFIIEVPVERQQRQEIPIVELDVTESSSGFGAQGSRRTYQAAQVPPPPPPAAEKTNLQKQYEAAMKAVEIPQNKYDHYLDLIDSLQKFAGGVDPQVKVQGIRNYYLKLKNNASGNDDKVLVLLYKTGFYSERDLLNTILSAMKKDFYSKFCESDTFSFLPHETGSQDVHSPGEKVTFFSNRRPRLRFHLVTAKSFIAEAQVNSILLYLCTFDPRCRPLIALARYWAQLNPGTFPESTSVNLANSHRKLVQPNGLDWMVIYFMECWGCIPKPAEIQSRDHLKLFDLETGTDIGFTADSAFMTEWKAKRRDVLEERIASDQSIISVLTLFKHFLREYNCKESLTIHLYTRDGQRATSGNELKGRQLILSHPLVPNWEFDFPGNLWPTFRMMGGSCDRLQTFLNSHSISGSEWLNLCQIMKAAK